MTKITFYEKPTCTTYRKVSKYLEEETIEERRAREDNIGLMKEYTDDAKKIFEKKRNTGETTRNIKGISKHGIRFPVRNSSLYLHRKIMEVHRILF